LAFNVAD